MKERQLNIICISGALASLFAIYLFSLYAVAYQTNICDLDTSMMDKTVKLTGEAKDVRVNDEGTFFTLSDNGCEIRAVMWSSTKEILKEPLNESNNITVEGFVESYRGELELIVKRIKQNQK